MEAFKSHVRTVILIDAAEDRLKTFYKFKRKFKPIQMGQHEPQHRSRPCPIRNRRVTYN